ncbi:T9SS type A sorting domain-containing protein [Flavobacteriales bacterium]|nr:T9SS type A sorting domain-containing protein [Flavobacteriales bacterium]
MQTKNNILGLFVMLIFSIFSNVCTSQTPSFRHVYGGQGDDFGQSIKATPDGGYIITGSTGSYGYGQSDVYVLKIDSIGQFEWSKSYGGSNIDWGYDIEIASDSGFVIGGYTNSFGAGGYDFYLIRTNKNGDTLWTKTYGGWNWDLCYSIAVTNDNGIVMVGETYSYGAGEKDIWIVKTDEFGDSLWTKTIGGTLDEIAHSVIENFAGEIVIAGESYTFSDDDSDGLFIKLDSYGNQLQMINYGGLLGQQYMDVIQSLDTSGYVCFGTTENSSSTSKMYLTKFDENGDFVWDKQFGSGTINTGSAIGNRGGGSMMVVSTNDHNVNDLEVIVTSPTGGFWAGDDHLGGNLHDHGTDIILAPDNHLVILGNTNSFGQGYSDVMIYKSTSSVPSDTSDYIGIIDTNKVQHPNSFTSLHELAEKHQVTIFPNPTSAGAINLTSTAEIHHVYLTNVMGQIIPTYIVKNGENWLITPKNEYLTGIYLLQVKTKHQVISKKVVFN